MNKITMTIIHDWIDASIKECVASIDTISIINKNDAQDQLDRLIQIMNDQIYLMTRNNYFDRIYITKYKHIGELS